MPRQVTAFSNSTVKRLRSLRDKKGRRSEGLFLAEGLRILTEARDSGRLPEIVEIPGHPWYIGVQFHPELKSKPFDPHPLFADFVRAALEKSRLV